MEEEMENDVEEEDTSSNDTVITHPFKPNEIEIVTQQFSVDTLIKRIEYGDINMNTDFQRRGNLWDEVKQSRLIESMLLGLPLPAFYFDTNSEKWDIIDGLQRCCSIRNFCCSDEVIKNSETTRLKLEGLEYLTELNGKSFRGLSRTLQRDIEERQITAHLLKKSPTISRYILFKRLNKGGLALTSPEIRNAIYQGKATDVLKKLSTMPEFLKVTDNKIKTNRMEDMDFVCRFVAFYLTDYNDYKPDLDNFLNDRMELLGKEEEAKIKSIIQNFEKALQLAIDIFGKDAFRKRVDKNAKRKPINKAYFEVITVNFSKLTDEEEKLLRQNSELLKDNLIELMRNKRYDNSLKATGTKDSVNIRFSMFHQVMQKSIQGKKVRITNDNKIEDC